MSLSLTERTNLIKLAVGMFNAAPGETYLAEITVLYEANGRSLANVANILANTPAYKALNPVFQTAAEFAAAFLTPLGLQANATAVDFVTARFNAGEGKGQIAVEALTALNNSTAPEFADARALLNNKAAVAEYYSVTLGVTSTDLSVLQGAVSHVTADPASVDTANSANSDANGQTFTLTNGVDASAAFTGTAGNDTFVANSTLVIDPATGIAVVVDSLQSPDSLVGGAGVDTLKVTLGNAASAPQPTLSGIENVEATFKAAGASLDLSGSTGVEKVTVSNSTAAAVVNGVGAAATLAVANQKTDVSFDGQTATTLALSLDAVGTVSATAPVQVKVDLGAAAASKATTLNITANNSNVEVLDTAGANVATAATIAATGANVLKLTDGLALAGLTVTGAGSVDVSSVGLVKVATLTVGDGGITFDSGDSTATSITATTGAGKDTLTLDGAVVKTVSTGAGNDSVTTATAALVATASINLGAGDDTLTLHAAPAAAGVTLAGGDGKDTLAVAEADFGTIATYAAADLAKITGFEVLSLTDAAVADGASIDLSKIAGLTGFQSKGVATGMAATVINVGANADIILKGDLGTNNGALTVTLKEATGSSDIVNLTLNAVYTENNDTTVDTAAVTEILVVAGVEVINVTSTGTADTPFLGATGNKADGVNNTLALTDTALTTLNVSGDQAFTFNTADAQTKLATIDASANTAGATISAAATTTATNAALTIKGSATAANSLIGSANSDTIIGGAKADAITGGAKGDTLTGNGGNDTFSFVAGDSSIGTGKFDTITDFVANTFGNGTNGASDTGADLTDATKVTGDVLSFVDFGDGTGGVIVDVLGSAADATTFLANNAATANTVIAVLDSSANNLYVDNTGDGVADFYIHLTGVTTINAAAFTLVA